MSVVIPAFNESRCLADTLRATIDYLDTQDVTFDVTVVDDGSTDGTSEIVREISHSDERIQLLSHKTNRGKGYAVRRGTLHASGQYRLFMDADNSTSIRHIEEFWPLLLDQEADIVIGSRRVHGASISVRQPRWKELLGDLGNRWIRLWAVSGILDTQAGFKAFRGEVVDELFPSLTIDGWGFDVEILAVAQSMGYAIAEQPIRWINDANSKVKLRSYLSVLREVLRVRSNIRGGVYPQLPHRECVESEVAGPASARSA